MLAQNYAAGSLQSVQPATSNTPEHNADSSAVRLQADATNSIVCVLGPKS